MDHDSKNHNADIIVIGSGGGLAAAVTAAEAGADVIVIEKIGVLGGYTKMANALMACESPVQKRKNVTITQDEIFRKFMDWNHWHRVEPRVVRAFVNQSGETIEWQEKKGVEFDLMPNEYRVQVIHVPKNMMVSVQNRLIEDIENLSHSTVPRLQKFSRASSYIKFSLRKEPLPAWPGYPNRPRLAAQASCAFGVRS